MPKFELASGSAVSVDHGARIRQEVRDFGAEVIGEADFEALHVYARGADGELIGGLVGGTYWSWLHIDSLWIDERHRCKGYGTQLLSMAEFEAISRGCGNAFLDTYSFHARSMYEKLGYRVVGTAPNFPAGHERYFMVKSLGHSDVD